MRKKILEFMFIIIMVVLVGCGNVINEMETEEEVLTSSIEDENQNENDKVEEETIIETLDFKETETVDNRYGIGDVIYFTSGLEVAIEDLGVCTDASYGYTYLYVQVTATNNGTEELFISSADFRFYGDDYSIEGYGAPDGNVLSNIIAPGRKARGRAYVPCDEYDSYSIIEAQIGDAIIVIKDEDSTNERMNDIDAMFQPNIKYGTYEMVGSDGNTYVVTFDFSNDPYAEMIMIEGYNTSGKCVYSDMGYGDWGGSVYIYFLNESGAEVNVSFYEDYANVYVLSDYMEENEYLGQIIGDYYIK